MLSLKAIGILLIVCVVLSHLFSICFSTAALVVVGFIISSKATISFILSEMKKDTSMEIFESLQARDERTHM
jgi:hypothetical protein